MTDPETIESCPPPADATLDDLRADLEEFKQAIVVRLEDIDSRLYELLYNQRAAGEREAARAMLTAALAAVETAGDDE